MAKTDPDLKLEKQDFDMFEALAALDRKDYGYYDRLTQEQQRKFVPFMMVHWMSAVKGKYQSDFLCGTNYYANLHLFNENVQNHPKLQWLMLCAASPGAGKQFHQWIPHIKDRVAKLKEKAKLKDMKEYFKKVYPGASANDISEISEVFVENHSRKMYLTERFPHLKFDELELLSELVTDEEIQEYERELGN